MMLQQHCEGLYGAVQSNIVWVEHPNQVHRHSIAIQQIASLATRN